MSVNGFALLLPADGAHAACPVPRRLGRLHVLADRFSRQSKLAGGTADVHSLGLGRLHRLPACHLPGGGLAASCTPPPHRFFGGLFPGAHLASCRCSRSGSLSARASVPVWAGKAAKERSRPQTPPVAARSDYFHLQASVAGTLGRQELDYLYLTVLSRPTRRECLKQRTSSRQSSGASGHGLRLRRRHRRTGGCKKLPIGIAVGAVNPPPARFRSPGPRRRFRRAHAAVCDRAGDVRHLASARPKSTRQRQAACGTGAGWGLSPGNADLSSQRSRTCTASQAPFRNQRPEGRWFRLLRHLPS